MPSNGMFDEAYYHTPPCCAGNQARIVPEFVHHTWWGSSDGGLVLTSFAPTRVNSTVAISTISTISTTTATSEGAAESGVEGGANARNTTATTTARVVLEVETAYPFSGVVNVKLLDVAADTGTIWYNRTGEAKDRHDLVKPNLPWSSIAGPLRLPMTNGSHSDRN